MVKRVKELIKKLGVTQKVAVGEQIVLTEKQIKILERIKKRGRITNKDLRAMFKISRQVISKGMRKLIDAKIIELVSKGT